VKSRFEVNPSVGGFLRSFFDKPSDLGKRVEQGTKLGEMVDIHTLEVVEEMKASVSGYLFFSRYSGVVDAGTKAFALAEEKSSTWLE
jgi:predicted deacylase